MEKYVPLDEERTEEHHGTHGTYPADVERVSNNVSLPHPPSPKRHKKSRRRVEVLEAGTPSATDLGEIFKELQEAVRLNNSYLKALCSSQGSKPDSDTIPVTREGQIRVEILLSFLHVIDVKTKQGCFHAEIYLQARWKEPGLLHCTQDDLDRLDFSKVWKPDLVLVNAVGEPDSVKTWYTGKEGGLDTTLCLHMRVRGLFTESLELNDFPVDKQDLTIIVTCERPVSEIKLVRNTREVATVTLETFSDAKEFTLWDNVEVQSLKADPQAADKYAKSSKLAFTCAVSRKPAYFLINGLLLQFLIGALTFLVYVQPYTAFSQRSALAATLLLTSVAFAFVVQNELPNVPYITIMGWYHLICRVFQVVIILETGIVFYIGQTNTNTAALLDFVSFWALLALFLLFNIIYLIILGIKYQKVHKNLVEKERQHRAKKTSWRLEIMEET